MSKTEAVSSFLAKAFPEAECSLIFSNPFECLCAVMHSAQATDESVNKATPALFRAFPDAKNLAKADLKTVEGYIQSIGLYHNKAKNLIALAKALEEKYGGQVPNDFAALTALPGVGIKTANVTLAECFARPSFPVDTHVGRVSKRLGFAREDDEPIDIEKKLEKAFPKEEWIPLHHRVIAFGRAICHAKKPECDRCELHEHCRYFKKTSLTTGKKS